MSYYYGRSAKQVSGNSKKFRKSRVILKLLTFFVVLSSLCLKGIYIFGLFFTKTAAPNFGRVIWRFLLLPSYKLIFKTKYLLKKFARFLLPALEKISVKEKFIWLSAFLIISLGVAIHNLKIERHVRAEDVGRESLLFKIIVPEDEFPPEIITEFEAPSLTERHQEEPSLFQPPLSPEINPVQPPVYYPQEEYQGIDLALKQPIISDLSSLQRDYSAPRTGIETYIVREADTLSDIADRFGISLNTLLWENDLTENSILRPGQKLSILPVSGVSHKVRKGDTLAKIAKDYNVPVEDIAEANQIAFNESIKDGEILVIPDGKPLYAAPARPQSRIARLKQILSIPLRIVEKIFMWPTTSRRITQTFRGWRHTGIDIGNNYGEPVFASASGVVEIVQRSRGGYGLYVIIRHPNGLQTLYAHNSKVLVTPGQAVSRGQTIAQIGSTGRSTGPHVHFEVRSQGNILNPFNYF